MLQPLLEKMADELMEALEPRIKKVLSDEVDRQMERMEKRLAQTGAHFIDKIDLELGGLVGCNKPGSRLSLGDLLR
jgi:hypothetical protein